MKGGPGSGNKDHLGIPGHQGGSLPKGQAGNEREPGKLWGKRDWQNPHDKPVGVGGSTPATPEQVATWNEEMSKPAEKKPPEPKAEPTVGETLTFNDISKLPGSNEGIAYVVCGALKDTKSHGDATQAFIDSVENENYYGSKPEIVKQRNKALDIFKDQLKLIAGDHKFDEIKYQKYIKSQSDEE
jgi:hypothetical protein